jgi:putative ABC transport system substrate-binding protein
MLRRDFIAGLGSAVAAWPVLSRAQQRERVSLVGVLIFNRDAQTSVPMQKLVSDELKKLGWIEGRNLRLDFRFGAGDVDRTRAEAVDLARLAPDVIVTGGRAALTAAQQATKTIPIMFVDGDPAELGFVKNYCAPRG